MWCELNNRLRGFDRSRHGVALGRTWVPLPQTRLRPSPEAAIMILIKRPDKLAETAIITRALHACGPNRAQPCMGNAEGAGPNRSLAVLEQRQDIVLTYLGVPIQLSVFPACQSFQRPDPEGTVTGGDQGPDICAWELITGRSNPRDESNTIESDQAELSTEPQITIGRLCNRANTSLQAATLNGPCCVAILAQFEGRIRRERGCAACQKGGEALDQACARQTHNAYILMQLGSSVATF